MELKDRELKCIEVKIKRDRLAIFKTSYHVFI